MIVTDKCGVSFVVFRSMSPDRKNILLKGKISPVEPCEVIAIQGSFGNEFSGWHCHNEKVDGDFATLDDVLVAHGLE
jgi:hypothetical protein